MLTEPPHFGQSEHQPDAGDPPRKGSIQGEDLRGRSVALLERLRTATHPPPHIDGEECRGLAGLTLRSLRARLELLNEDTPPSSCLAVDVEVIDSYLTTPSRLRLLLAWQRLCQQEAEEAWSDVLARASDLSAAERRQLRARGSAYLFRYAGLFDDRAAQALEALLARTRGAAPTRFEAISQFLRGGLLVPSWLDFDLERRHLAVIAWGNDHGGLVRRLAGSLERPFLAVETPDRGATWAWLSGARELRALDSKRFEEQGGGAGARAALGLDLVGPAGFRASHRQARRVRRLAERSDSPLLRYEDFALELILSEDPGEARAFAEHELAGISDDSSASATMRETLSAYFAAEHNAASAAASLGVHQQTVANRLRRAEERLGRPITSRRLELELALRLRTSASWSDVADQRRGPI
jgi:hypothetical protein